MDDQSVFDNERQTLRNAMELLSSGSVPPDLWPDHYGQLIREYGKLLRQSERLVRIGDMMQEQLNTLNAQLDHHRRVAEQASKAKSQFLAMMSHDIRNPMASVAVMTDLLMQTELSADQLEYLTGIRTASNSLVRLLDESLDLSRIEAGKLDLIYADFGLWDCVGDALRAAAFSCYGKPITICSFIDRHVPFHCIGDCGRLGQILMNLLSNAVKFTEEGEIVTRVQVQDRAHDTVTLHFSVSDSGEGIPVDRLDSVFDEFEQASNRILGKYGGTGLGLAICSKLVRSMNGKIWVESEEGKGSTFHFSLPFAVAPEWLGDSGREEFARLKGLRLLVASNIPACKAMLSEFLENWAVSATVASDGETALYLAKQAYHQGKPFAIILIDSSMPEMRSLDLARQLVADPETRDSRIVLLTELDSLSLSAEASKLGIAHRISKPPRLLDLLTTILKALEAPLLKPAEPQAHHKNEPRQDDNQLNILVAEDNPINRILAVRMLERMGQQVVAVSDGEAVLKSLAENDFDLILMDVEMPRKNGLETTRAIRESEIHTGKHITIIATTAHVLDDDRQRLMDAGVDAYITKPIDWKQLLKTAKSIG